MEGAREMDISRFLGWAAAGLLILGNLYTPFKLLSRLLNLNPVEDKSLVGQLSIIQRSLLNLHCYGNIGATVLSAIHTLLLSSGRPHNDIFAWASLAIMTWLSISGLILRTKFFPSNSKRAIRLLHAQYVLTAVLVAILGIHILIGGESEFEGLGRD